MNHIDVIDRYQKFPPTRPSSSPLPPLLQFFSQVTTATSLRLLNSPPAYQAMPSSQIINDLPKRDKDKKHKLGMQDKHQIIESTPHLILKCAQVSKRPVVCLRGCGWNGGV
ncbi:hypothetical protein ONS95_006328 [Cadophora gregata]|uniref:uncharacterized protein n=1 Tax=Cadophora gregata TaxID=51156 RepID=UPI0026DBF489|nr:uncharacterized protein ONS95_006328 [Cadophora gregata]KAK0099311.1 hypothetical protein ONS96_008540 [Cadophora gregata f. sp. sojae]KAK0102727.1 hypothetical protein ONS95_006328 [Cadophora gregata]